MSDDERDRLAALEGIVRENSRRLDQGIIDQGKMAEQQQMLRKAVEGIQGTLQNMASDEIADLKRRAELPSRLIRAVLVPVIVAVITAATGAILTGVHL